MPLISIMTDYAWLYDTIPFLTCAKCSRVFFRWTCVLPKGFVALFASSMTGATGRADMPSFSYQYSHYKEQTTYKVWSQSFNSCSHYQAKEVTRMIQHCTCYCGLPLNELKQMTSDSTRWLSFLNLHALPSQKTKQTILVKNKIFFSFFF